MQKKLQTINTSMDLIVNVRNIMLRYKELMASNCIDQQFQKNNCPCQNTGSEQSTGFFF